LFFLNKTFNQSIITFVRYLPKQGCVAKKNWAKWSGTAVKFLAAFKLLMKGKSVKDCCNLTSQAPLQKENTLILEQISRGP
jgi:hypothetical protein